MAMDTSIIKKLVDEKVNSMCDVSEWYNYPFVTDVEISKEKIENGDISEEELEECKNDFMTEILQPVIIYVLDRMDLPVYSINPNLDFLYDMVKEEILNLIK